MAVQRPKAQSRLYYGNQPSTPGATKRENKGRGIPEKQVEG
jgi:hypothetical protein